MLAATITGAAATSHGAENPLRKTDSDFFLTADAARIGRQVIAYQRETGGWPKNIDMAREMSEQEIADVLAEKGRRDDSTTDNNATTMQMAFLARLYKATGDSTALAAFRHGVDYLLYGQYPNGGWPQFWPEMRGYQEHITFNDNAMVNTLTVIRDIRDGREPYDTPGLVDRATSIRLEQAFDRGIECILATQIIADGEPTVWAQQYDRNTLKPAKARAYELPAYCSMESMAIAWLLMDIPNPSAEIRRAIEGAMKWYDRYKITGYRVERTGTKGAPDYNTVLIADENADPIWARYYDLEQCEPFVCGRDGIPRKHLEEIEPERRNGYCWFSAYPNSLYKRYERWKAENSNI